jgi:hypothetical protein
MPQIILDFTQTQADRMAPAFGFKLHPGSPTTPATLTEVHDDIMAYCKQLVFSFEDKKAVGQLPPPAEFT